MGPFWYILGLLRDLILYELGPLRRPFGYEFGTAPGTIWVYILGRPVCVCVGAASRPHLGISWAPFGYVLGAALQPQLGMCWGRFTAPFGFAVHFRYFCGRLREPLRFFCGPHRGLLYYLCGPLRGHSDFSVARFRTTWICLSPALSARKSITSESSLDPDTGYYCGPLCGPLRLVWTVCQRKTSLKYTQKSGPS